ncbi:unnamed protein product [Dicrocoelium dendriticum]|nr:unnamed protein product [Dicrocoelium dendriticum]
MFKLTLHFTYSRQSFTQLVQAMRRPAHSLAAVSPTVEWPGGKVCPYVQGSSPQIKQEGRLEEVIDRFVLLYRSTSNPQAPDGVSPTQAIMNRKLRMPFHTIRLRSESSVGERNRRMEQDFNRRHGAKKRSFTLGQKVLVHDYREGHAKWTPGTVKSKRGNIMYDVMVGAQIWPRHANQLRPTLCQPEQARPTDLPFNILVKSFSSPKAAVDDCTQSSKASRTRTSERSSQALLPRRCTDRQRTPSRRLQVNPKLSSYTSGDIS